MNATLDSLAAREELHREIVSRSPNAIFLVDVGSGVFLDANPATVELLGYEPDELSEIRFDDVDLGAADESSEVVSRVKEEHHDILGERLFRRKDGHTVPVEVSANLVILRGREVVCFFARDISERRQAEVEQERLQRALWLSQKHEAVGQLAAGIAHDFNNQLMVIQLCAQMVSQQLSPADPSQQELSELVAAGKSATALIRQLLAFSGKQLLRPSLIEVDEVLGQEEKMLRRTLGEHIKIDTNYGASKAAVYVDRTQLEQVILNLAVNARDAMPGGGTFTMETSVVEVTDDFVSDYATLRSGPHVLLRVSDTGVGMNEETLGRVFEPFFTTKGAGKGTGLGLATVYGIVKQSGGSIWASSRPGEGTSFRIYLPVSDGEAESTGTTRAADARDVPGGDERVLIVDDDEMVRVLASRILRDLGYRVVEIGDPDEAIEAYVQARGESGFDLILTDVVMPNRSGPEMVREIENHASDLRVIFMSGYSDGRIRVDELETKEYVFLEKPLGRSELANAVRTTLDR